MDEEKLFTLLGKIIETNEAVLRQNDRFLEFLHTRDERIPERTALEIQNLRDCVESSARDRDRADKARKKETLERNLLVDMGLTEEELIQAQLEESVASMRQAKQWRLELEARVKAKAETKAAE